MTDTNLPPQMPETPPKRRVSPRVLRIALGISVALNLLVFGAVGGSLFHGGPSAMRGEMTRDLGFGPFSESLDPQDRRALREWLKARAPELRSANAQRRKDIAAVQSALRAQPFDAAALEKALVAMRARMEGQLALGHLALTEVILAMPPSERVALADRLERGMRRGGNSEGRPDDRRNGEKKAD